MRFALILSLLLAILAVVFALQNPAYTNVNIGPWDVRGSTALILLVTLSIGVLVGVLATLPTILKRRKRIRHLERHAADVQADETTATTSQTTSHTTPPEADVPPKSKKPHRTE